MWCWCFGWAHASFFQFMQVPEFDLVSVVHLQSPAQQHSGIWSRSKTRWWSLVDAIIVSDSILRESTCYGKISSPFELAILIPVSCCILHGPMTTGAIPANLGYCVTFHQWQNFTHTFCSIWETGAVWYGPFALSQYCTTYGLPVAESIPFLFELWVTHSYLWTLQWWYSIAAQSLRL